MRLISIETRQAPFIDTYRETALRQGYDLVLTPHSPEPSPAFAAFAAVYQHNSDNPYDFELNCFRRYFDALEYAEPTGSIVISDTDQLILSPPDALPDPYLAPEAVVGSRGTSCGVAEFDISPHFSKWPTQILRRFTDFLIQIYTDTPELLAAEYERRRTVKKRAAVSDMTLFNMFVDAEKIPFYDSNSLKYEYYVDHNFSMRDTRDGSFRTEFGFKAFRSNGSGGIILLTATDDIVRPASLHLQGRAKPAAVPMNEGRLNAARARLALITAARSLRGFLQ